MSKQEIKTELESVIYVLETLENDYAALKLKAVLDALKQEWNESDYYAQRIATWRCGGFTKPILSIYD